MAKTLKEQELRGLTELCPILSKLPFRKIFVDYDDEADVLYIRFRRPANIYQSQLTDNDVLLEFNRKGELVGVTILDASRRQFGRSSKGKRR